MKQLTALLKPTNPVELSFDLLPFDPAVCDLLREVLATYTGSVENLYDTVQFELCIAQAKSPFKISFGTLCVWMVQLEDVFREETGMTKESVFERYLATNGSATYIAAKTVQSVIRKIYEDEELTKDGFHTPVLRALLRDLSNRAMKESENEKLCTAGKLVERLLDLSIGEYLDGISMEDALGIVAVIVNAGNKF